MTNKSLYTLSLFCLISISSIAQYGGRQKTSLLSDVTFGAGVASISFFGEMNKENPIPSLSINRPGYTFMVEKRFGDFLGLSLEGMLGKTAHSQRTISPLTNLNFESKLNQFGLNVSFHSDNDAIFKKRSSLSPYVSVGAAITLFDPHGDLYDANGNQYYYWENGYIMDRPQSADSLGMAQQLDRDYSFETQLTDSLNDYSRNTISFPLTFGLKWKLSHTISVRAYGTYVLTQSDFIDNYSIDNRNDKYLYTGVSVNISLKAVDNSGEGRYKNVDFKELLHSDSDGDGVKDLHDECPDTPPGMDTDSRGCWANNDDDNDGIPNVLDEEPNTAEGMKVDAQGISLPVQPQPEVEGEDQVEKEDIKEEDQEEK